MFKAALMEVPVVADSSTLADLSMADTFMSYESSMTELVDRFLPLHLVTIRRCPTLHGLTESVTPCGARPAAMNGNIGGLVSHLTDRVQFARYMHRQYHEKDRTYWEDRLSSHRNKPKSLWATFNALLSRRHDSAGHSSEESSFTEDDFLAAYIT